MAPNLHKLSLPRNLSTDENDDTFSKDLLRQFDKKRSRLHYELGFASQEPSPESSRITTPVLISEYLDEEPIQLDDDEIQPVVEPPRHSQEQQQYEQSNYSNTTSKRSISASDLLRRSSAYLKSKFDLLKRNKSQDDNLISIDNNKSPTKVLMKTTISIPSSSTTTTATTTARSSFSPLLTPPTITQYPPKPLVYSPIEPIPNNNNTSQQDANAKPLLHRLSMPLMRVYNDTASISRNRSIISFGGRRKSEPDNNTKRKLRKAKQQ